MKIKLFLITAALVILGGFIKTYGQGKIILLNGKEKRFKTAVVKGEFLEYQPEEADSGKIKLLDKYDVFSLLHDSTGEELIYSPDTVVADEPTVQEARDYILGEKYAALVYKEPANFVTGFEVGITSGFILPAFYGIAPPVIYPFILGQFTPKVKTPLLYKYDTTTFAYNPIAPNEVGQSVVSKAFMVGYGKKAKNIKVYKSLLGGALGFAVGITAVAIIINNY